MSAMAEDGLTRNDLAEVTDRILGRLDGVVGQVNAVEGRFHSFTQRMETMFIDFQRNIIAHIDENFATKQELAAAEDRLVEKIHDTETRILRGYEFHARAVEAHLKTLDGQSAANFLAQMGLGERMSALEARMLDLELGKRPPQ